MSDFAINFSGEAERIPLHRLAALFVATNWSWSLNNRCKHLVFFMDTRDERFCRVYDRDYKALTFDEVAHQLQVPRLPGEEHWYDRNASTDELTHGLAMAAAIIEAGEKDRRELLARIAALEAKVQS